VGGCGSRSALKLSFVAGGEFARYENKSHPENNLCSWWGEIKISGRDSSLVLRVVKRDNEHRFVDRTVVTVNTNRNYVFLSELKQIKFHFCTRHPAAKTASPRPRFGEIFL